MKDMDMKKIVLGLGLAFIVTFAITQFFGKGRYQIVYGITAASYDNSLERLDWEYQDKTLMLDTITGKVWYLMGRKWQRVEHAKKQY